MEPFHHRESVRRHAGRFLVIIAATAFLCGACTRTEQPMRADGEAQGTYYSVLYYDRQHRDLSAQIDSLLDAFDQTASLWVDSSLLRRLNAGSTTLVTPLFADILDKALLMNRYTDGAFDCRIGRIVQAWGFSFRERSEPDSSTLATLLAEARGGIALHGDTLVRENAGTELDFNAIAQGYASDLVARWLEHQGIERYLVDIGGEVIARGEKEGGKAWRVGIERPAEDRYSAPVVETSIALRDAAVVTSGSYRKYYERDGVRYSHTINPATGRPVEHTLLSVSVVEKECWLADAMATAYMVMGLDSALAFIACHPGEPGTDAVLFLYDDHGTLRSHATEAWNSLSVER